MPNDLGGLCESVEVVLEQRRVREGELNVVVAIGRSKDFVDTEAVRRFLKYLQQRGVAVTNFAAALSKLELSN
jgi:intergrase/recombinase